MEMKCDKHGWLQARDFCHKCVADYLRAVNCHEELVAALEAVEWVYDSEIDGLFCPTCALPKPTHTRGCQLAAALAKAKENTAHEARLQQRDLDEETL